MVIKANSFSQISCWTVSLPESNCWSDHSLHQSRSQCWVKDIWAGERSKSWSRLNPWSRVWSDDWALCSAWSLNT